MIPVEVNRNSHRYSRERLASEKISSLDALHDEFDAAKADGPDAQPEALS
jgi:hypothetical protein